MRYLDAMLKSNEFWGIIALVFLAIGSWRGGAVRVPALLLAWLAGSFALYRIWVLHTIQDWRLLALLLPAFAIVLLFFCYWSDPHRPVSRAISGEPIGRGPIVAAASLLNVGGSPSQEPIQNPPDWIEPTTGIHLIFQDSPLLTDDIKNQVTRDLSAFREYLLRLGIPVSDEFPPIGVGNGPGSSQTHVLGSLPTYRSSVTVTRNWFVDRKAITGQYSYYAIDEAFRRRAMQDPSGSGLQDVIAASASSQYYNWSFWDFKPNEEGGYWSSQLWAIRSSFGKDFTDRLLGFTIKSILDSPAEGADANFDIYFHRKLQQGDSVIDSNPERMSKITEIIEKSGIKLTTPRAYFDFSAAAVKRYDGSYLVSVEAMNKSEVPAIHGQFRMYFAPDVRLLREPKGSFRDSLTTLQSSRLISFDSISAHTSSKINVEFRPISESFGDLKFLVVHFDYRCETCGNDSYSHDLKFRLDLFDAKD